MHRTEADNAAGRLLEKVREKFSRLGHEEQTVRDKLAQVNALRGHLRDTFGMEWRKCQLLDVGCGQLLGNAYILGVENEVVGIDMALPFRFPFVADFVDSLLHCGAKRAAQTAVRQMLGMDRRFRYALRRQLGLQALPEIKTQRMNAERLGFRDGQFDGAYSFSVMQCVADPLVAVQQLHRILKPGGVAYVQLHLYTSLGGSDHPLLWIEPEKYPAWAHLRESTPYYRKHGLPVNEWRLAQYKDIFESVFDDVHYVYYEAERQQARDFLTPSIRAELHEYSEEELLTTTFTILARKQKGSVSLRTTNL